MLQYYMLHVYLCHLNTCMINIYCQEQNQINILSIQVQRHIAPNIRFLVWTGIQTDCQYMLCDTLLATCQCLQIFTRISIFETFDCVDS